MSAEDNILVFHIIMFHFFNIIHIPERNYFKTVFENLKKTVLQ